MDELAFVDAQAELSWCIQVTNTGQATAYGVEARTVLPHRWSYVPSSTTGSGWPVGQPTVATTSEGLEDLSWDVGDLAPGASVEIRYRAIGAADAPVTVVSTSTVRTFSAAGEPIPARIEGSRASDSARATTSSYGLEASNSPAAQLRPFLSEGGQVSWTITVSNPAPDTTVTDLRIVDTLPSPLTYASWTSATPAVQLDASSDDEVVVWTLNELAPDTSVSIRVTADLAAGSSVVEMARLVNDVEVTARELPDALVGQAEVRFYEPASLGNEVWLDADADGIRDATELGSAGHTVRLLDPTGAQLHRDQTTGVLSTDEDAGFVALETTSGDNPATTGVTESGWFEFEDLPAGNYVVEVVAGDGFDLTFTNQGANEAADSDPDRGSGRTATFSLTSGEDRSDVDAGVVIEADNEIGDHVWNDLNADGVQAVGEGGLHAATVKLVGAGPDRELGTADDAVLDIASTDDGAYRFTDLPDHLYRIQVDPPAGTDLTPTWEHQGSDAWDSDIDRSSRRTGNLDLDSAQAVGSPVIVTDVDAGFMAAGHNSIGDRVWLDNNQDGVQDAGEVGAAGAVVKLLHDATGDMLANTTTDAAGNYEFAELPDGRYRLQFVRIANTVPTWIHQGSDDGSDSDAQRASGLTGTIELDPDGETSDAIEADGVDAGFIHETSPSRLGDFVWHDGDADGTQGPAEMGMDGVRVDLLDAGADREFGTVDDRVLSSTTTGDNPGTDLDTEIGWYRFKDLPDGTYVLRFVPPAGSAPTWRDFGDDEVDSDIDRDTARSAPLTLNGHEHSSIDAGFFVGSNGLSEVVWLDQNRNGIHDEGELPLGGVQVSLRSAGVDGARGTSDDLTLDTVSTDGSGRFRFERIPDGHYWLAFSVDDLGEAHQGLAPTWPGQGDDPDADSDVDRATGLTPTIGLDPDGVEDEPVMHLTSTAGFLENGIPPARLQGVVWLDDWSGVREGTEPGIEGVEVELLDPASGAVLLTTTTAASGAYSFSDLPAGTYDVRVELDGDNPAHDELVPTWADQGADDSVDSDAVRHRRVLPGVVLAAGAVSSGHDAGFADGSHALNELRPRAWLDTNRNGLRGSAEPALEGVTTELVGPGSDTDFGTVDDTVLAIHRTDGSGATRFSQLPDGQYRIRFQLDDQRSDHVGLELTSADAGDDDSLDSDVSGINGLTPVIPLDPAGASDTGVVDASVFAGYFPSGTIGGLVWNDVNRDGHRDGDEVGVAGVRVNAVHATTGEVVAGGVTLADGSVRLRQVPPGQYRVAFELATLPPHHVPTVSRASVAAAAAPPAVDDTGRSGVFELGAGERVEGLQFGIYEVAVDYGLNKWVGSVTANSAEWVLVVTNRGTDVGAGPITVTDRLPPMLRYSSSSGVGWSCGAASENRVTCSYEGALAAGDKTPELRVVTVRTGASSTEARNSAVVDPPASDPDAGDNTDSAAVTFPGGGGISLPKTGADLVILLAQLGGAVIVVGWFLVAAARRRNRREREASQVR